MLLDNPPECNQEATVCVCVCVCVRFTHKHKTSEIHTWSRAPRELNKLFKPGNDELGNKRKKKKYYVNEEEIDNSIFRSPS